jgi:aerobic carbon-monoxide dehydrogenase small subunit
MTNAVDVTVMINGEPRVLRVAPFETLLTSLRDRLGLTATKRGCDQGVCGACSVLIDARPARACLSVTANCVDQEVTTVEGLSTPLELTSLQAALVRAGAIQCGFCTPGILISLTALLQECPHPTRDDIRTAISSNICRCTGYQKIVEAVAGMGEGSAA